ncbi:hypothetical protein MSBR3_2401 [Methanosarcina barkeri 3]|uniref:Uncharacterized protein n=1 Tax=Methanosarcina barkeri 3 TaxID=1434107 RepID=A0A0E3WXY5_METBA|nr:hypothetical protein [Methanosarcina barkeri]AKB82979.1 hypothetical protein MSBR3_2401 [Methanosarcina barkeri 3]
MSDFHLDISVVPKNIFEFIEIAADLSSLDDSKLSKESEEKLENYKKRQSHLTAMVKKVGITSKELKLTELGEKLYKIMYDDETLFYNILHYLLYTQYYFEKRNHASWVYNKFVDILYENREIDEMRISDFNENFALKIVNLAREELNQEGISFRGRSISPLISWVGSLNPSCINHENKKISFKLRNFCQPQLFLLAIDYAFKKRKAEYGSLILITDNTIADICKICLIDPESFDSCFDLCKKSFDFVDFSIGWEKHIRLNREPKIDDFI